MHEHLVERHPTDNAAEHLLFDFFEDEAWMEMADLNRETTRDTEDKGQQSYVEGRYTDGEPLAEASGGDGDEVALVSGIAEQDIEYRVYKIRWFGLTQLILLNIIGSWDVCLL